MLRYQITSKLVDQKDLEEILSAAYNTGRTKITLYDANNKVALTFNSFNYGRAHHDAQRLLLEGVWKIECTTPGHSASEEGRKPECVDATKVALSVAAWAATGTPFLR